MPTGPNMHFDNEWMGESAGNLATIFAGDPKTRMMRDYYGSGALENEAQAAKANAEASDQAMRTAARAKLTPELLATFGRQIDPKTNLPESALVHLARTSAIQSAIMQSGMTAKDIADALNVQQGSIYAQGTDDEMRQSMVTQGKPVPKDFAPSAAAAKDVYGYERAATDSVANINKSSAANVAGINARSAIDQIIEKGTNVNAGETHYNTPGSRSAKAFGDKPLTGMPTETTARGEAVNKYAGGNQDPRIRDIVFDTPPAGSPPKSKGQPVLVDQKKLDDILFVALRDVEGAIDNKGTTSESVNPRFRAMFDRATWADAESAASKMLQNNRTAREAADEFKRVAGMDNVTGMHKDSGWWGSKPDELQYGTPAKVVLDAGNKTPPPQPNGAPQQTPAQPKPLAFDRSEILGSTTNAQGKEIYMVRDKNTNKKIWVDAQRHQVQ